MSSGKTGSSPPTWVKILQDVLKPYSQSLNRKSFLIILISRGFVTGKVRVESILDLCSQTKIKPNPREKISEVVSNLACIFKAVP